MTQEKNTLCLVKLLSQFDDNIKDLLLSLSIFLIKYNLGNQFLSKIIEDTILLSDINRLISINNNNPPFNININDFIYFGSGMKISVLSNFALCDTPFFFRGKWWTTSEHAYQAILRVEEKDWDYFAVGGELSTEYGLERVFSQDIVQKKKKFYGPTQTGRPAMLGVIAKMAVKPDVIKKMNLPIRLKTSNESYHTIDEMSNLFMGILEAKYKANPRLFQILKNTDNKLLIEFSRGAERETLKGRPPLWAGMVGKDGKMYGFNLQGIIHMRVRKELMY